MKISSITTGLFLLAYLTAFSSSDDSLRVEDVIDYSLNDLMKIPVKVSSTQPVDILNSPSSVTIIDHQLLERYGFTTVAEALTIVPGMDVLQTIIDRDVATSRGILQNFYANKILLMINNVPTWQPIYGDAQLARIDLNDVERIEVLKGPASVLYGSNAYTGVINIILKNNDKEEAVRVHASAGYPQLGSAGASIKYSHNDLNIFVSGNLSSEKRKPYEMKSAKGFEYQGDSLFMMKEIYNNQNFNVLTNYKAHSLLLNVYSADHTHLGANLSYSSGAGTMVNNNGLLLNYQFKKNVSKKLRLIGSACYDFFARSFTLTPDRSNLIKLGGSRIVGDVKMNYRFSKYLNLDLGTMGEYRISNGHDTYNGIRDTLVRHNLTQDDNIYEWSAYSQLNISIWKTEFLGGIRYTSNQYTEGNFSFRGTALLKVNQNNSLKVIIGNSFRVPTMFELYFDHPTVKGNLNLKPETSLSYEIAYVLKKGGMYFNLLAYWASYENMIQRYSPSAGSQNLYRNAPKFTGYGIESELKYVKPSVGQFFINYNYLTGKDTETYTNYQYVPDHTLSYGISKTIKKIYLSANGKLISETMGPRRVIKPQHFLDLKVGYFHRINKTKIHHSITAKNITGSDFLMPEYIRSNDINEIPSSAFGTRFIYTLTLNLN